MCESFVGTSNESVFSVDGSERASSVVWNGTAESNWRGEMAQLRLKGRWKKSWITSCHHVCRTADIDVSGQSWSAAKRQTYPLADFPGDQRSRIHRRDHRARSSRVDVRSEMVDVCSSESSQLWNSITDDLSEDATHSAPAQS
jgi:Tfp pilus tip-associated adhesin PilY1